MASEIGRRRFLTALDNAATNIARPREQGEQPVAIAPTDHALQGAQIFCEPS